MNDSLKKIFPKSLSFFSFSLFFIFMLLSCTRGTESDILPQGTIRDALGRNYVLNEKPLRIVSLNPAVTEILFAIGAGEHIAGVTQFCDYPEEALGKRSMGGFSGAAMSMEQIRSVEPDLVILSADMHARIVALLDELKISSFAVEPRNFTEVYDVIKLIGEITGFSDGAISVITEMKNRIDRVEEYIQDKPRPSVFWILSEEPLMSVGSGSFVSEAIELGGGQNIFADIREQWPLVSTEQVLLRRPEWILRELRHGGGGGDVQEFWRTLSIMRNVKTALVNPDALYRYGPRLAEGVESIARILHGFDENYSGETP